MTQEAHRVGHNVNQMTGTTGSTVKYDGSTGSQGTVQQYGGVWLLEEPPNTEAVQDQVPSTLKRLLPFGLGGVGIILAGLCILAVILIMMQGNNAPATPAPTWSILPTWLRQPVRCKCNPPRGLQRSFSRPLLPTLRRRYPHCHAVLPACKISHPAPG